MFLGYLVVGTVQAIFGGFILSLLWSWFIVPKFAVPALTTMQAIGVLTVIGFPLLGLHVNTANDKTLEELLNKSLAYVFLVYPLCLATAWVWHQFITF